MATNVVDVVTKIFVSKMSQAVRSFIKYRSFLSFDEPDTLIASLMYDVDHSIECLLQAGKLGQYELFLLTLYSRGFTVVDISVILHSSRVDEEINRVCTLIGNELGDNYFE